MQRAALTQDVTLRAMGLRTAHFLSASTQVRLPNRQTRRGITVPGDALTVRVKVRDWPAASKRSHLMKPPVVLGMSTLTWAVMPLGSSKMG